MDVWDFRLLRDPAALQGYAFLSHIFSMAAPEANLKYQANNRQNYTQSPMQILFINDKTVGSQIQQLHTNHMGSAKMSPVFILNYTRNTQTASVQDTFCFTSRGTTAAAAEIRL